MFKFTFTAEPSRRVVSVQAKTQAEGRSLAWEKLPEIEKRNGADIECVGVETIPRIKHCDKLSEIHRNNHCATLTLARNMRQDSASHARFLELAKHSRFYFAKLRDLGE